MTVLLNKSGRDALNLGNLERNAIWAGLQLKSVLAGSPAVAAVPASGNIPAKPARAAVNPVPAYNKFFRITPVLLPPVESAPPKEGILIECRFSVIVATAIKNGGDFLGAIKEFGTLTPAPVTAIPGAISPTTPMPEPPSDINTLEKFYVWLLRQLKAKNSKTVAIACLEEGTDAQIKTELILPIDSQVWYSTGNLISAVEDVTPPSENSGTSGGSGGGGSTTISNEPLDNDHYVSNFTYFGN